MLSASSGSSREGRHFGRRLNTGEDALHKMLTLQGDTQRGDECLL